MKKDIFDLLKVLETKSENINNIFGCCDFLDNEISILWKIIEESYGIKNSPDESSEILFSFGCGEISKKQAQNKLQKLGITQNTFLKSKTNLIK